MRYQCFGNREEFLTLKKVLVFLLALVMLTSMVWADSNGVWHEAEDVRGTVFGADEGYPNYIFNSTVNFKKELQYKGAELDALYINTGETGDSLQDNTVDNSEIQNSGSFTFGGITSNGNLDMNNNDIEQAKNIYANVFYDRDNTGYAVEPAAGSNMNILRVYGKLNMNGNNINNIGKIGNVDSTDNIGNLNADMVDGQDWNDIQSWVNSNDDVNDADHNIGNEYPQAGTGIDVSGRTVNVDTGTIATKNYVDNNVAGISDTSAETECSGNQYLGGDGNCYSDSFEADTRGSLSTYTGNSDSCSEPCTEVPKSILCEGSCSASASGGCGGGKVVGCIGGVLKDTNTCKCSDSYSGSNSYATASCSVKTLCADVN